MSTGGSSSSAAHNPVSDIESMKVPELKKRLKSMGLPTVGNKAELVDRLQDAYLCEKEGSLDGGLDDDSLEEALLNDDPEHSVASPEKSLMGEFSFSSPEKEPPKEAALKPLKKRAIAHVDPVKVPKTIVLKRDNYPTSDLFKQAEEKKERSIIEPPKSSEAVKAVKVLSETERMQIRAKRFNLDDPASKVAVVAPTTRMSSAKPQVLAAAAPVSTALNVKNLEQLRKRAERFGCNVSTVMKKLEVQEKLLKRKLKFNESVSAETSQKPLSPVKPLGPEQEKKRKRLERFGLVK